MNMAGNIGGALSPIVFGILVHYGSWRRHSSLPRCCWLSGRDLGFWLNPSVGDRGWVAAAPVLLGIGAVDSRDGSVEEVFACLVIGSDHAGFPLKQPLIEHLRQSVTTSPTLAPSILGRWTSRTLPLH